MANGSCSGRHRLTWYGRVVALVGALLAAAPLGAQVRDDGSVTVLRSGLFSVFGGHTFQLTVAEVGSLQSSSEVVVEFRDAADNRRAVGSGVLRRGAPVMVRVPVAAPRYEMLRALVRITGLTAVDLSRTVVTLEDLDARSFVVETKPPCAPPPSRGGGPEGDCGGWQLDRFGFAVDVPSDGSN